MTGRRIAPSTRAWLLAAVVLGVMAARARPAAAYTQFQFSSGTNRCSLCHFSPAGTGLINAWGRDEAGDTISMGGDGAFLHGLVTLPSWLALGLDFRLAGLRNDVGGADAPEYALFPMQLDVTARAAYEAFSVLVTVGDRGVVRTTNPNAGSRIGEQLDEVLSPQHYIMWRPSSTGPYVRAGRFFTPYGLRFVEHIFYVQRYTGYNLFEQTYNVSGGWVADDWEVHVSAYTPPPSGAPAFFAGVGSRESGGVAYAEKRFAGMASIGLQAKAGVSTPTARYQGGGIGKLWIDAAKLLFLGEADFIRLDLRQANAAETQFVSYVGLTAFPTRGLMVGLAYERFQEDLALSTTARNAGDVEINFFPWAHFEFNLLGRIQKAANAPTPAIPPVTSADAATLVMLQFHYYM
jgi:hypothetical protein